MAGLFFFLLNVFLISLIYFQGGRSEKAGFAVHGVQRTPPPSPPSETGVVCRLAQVCRPRVPLPTTERRFPGGLVHLNSVSKQLNMLSLCWVCFSLFVPRCGVREAYETNDTRGGRFKKKKRKKKSVKLWKEPC